MTQKRLFTIDFCFLFTNLQLCVGGSWMESVTVEMDPLDAGTDNGFTFTAPNWPTDPQGVIYRITSRYPAHPAGSFFYPQSKRLPPIATFQFIKVSMLGDDNASRYWYVI